MFGSGRSEIAEITLCVGTSVRSESEVFPPPQSTPDRYLTLPLALLSPRRQAGSKLAALHRRGGSCLPAPVPLNPP